MKLDKDKLNTFWKSKYRKPLLFFGFYIFFFTLVIAVMQISPNNNNDDHDESSLTKKDMWQMITNNYEYHYEIVTDNNHFIIFEGKRYNNKNLYTEKIDDNLINEVYIFYDDIYIKKDNDWVDYAADYEFLDNLVDEHYLNPNDILDYVKEQISTNSLDDTIVNFDGTKSQYYTLSNLKIEVISENDILKKIIITDLHSVITLQYKNINKVTDFVVKK